jgi:hypothetical protein
MTPEEIWRGKSDDDLIAALMRLKEYTPAGQLVIKREAAHRGLEVWRDAQAPHQSEFDQLDPAPVVSAALVIPTICWVGGCVASLFAYSGPPIDPKYLGDFAMDPIKTTLTVVVLGLWVLVGWIDYFKKKDAWNRRHRST